jgi:hypothetical protein
MLMSGFEFERRISNQRQMRDGFETLSRKNLNIGLEL